MERTRGRQLQHKVKIEWSSNFAYAIGLITSDGNLSGDGRHMAFSSSEIELMEKFRDALLFKNVITPCGRGGTKEKKYFQLHFGDKVFYKYLNSIGLTDRKSKTIQAVKVPPQFFADFLRGLFDGDGSFYSFWDKRWPNSYGYQMAFPSASKNFVIWLKNKLTHLYQVKGFIRPGKGVFVIRYVKRDAVRLYNVMYYTSNLLFLNRKYTKIKDALEFDNTLRIARRSKKAAVA